MHSCMIFSVSIFSLNSSPMYWMLPSMRRRAFRSSCAEQCDARVSTQQVSSYMIRVEFVFQVERSHVGGQNVNMTNSLALRHPLHGRMAISHILMVEHAGGARENATCCMFPAKHPGIPAAPQPVALPPAWRAAWPAAVSPPASSRGPRGSARPPRALPPASQHNQLQRTLR